MGYGRYLRTGFVCAIATVTLPGTALPAAATHIGDPSIGLVAITGGETARLNMVAAAIGGTPDQPSGTCAGSLGFVDASGLPYIEQTVSAAAEQGRFVDLSGASIQSSGTGTGSPSGPTANRFPVRAVADIECERNLRPIFTVEVFKSASGRLEAVMGGVPDPGWRPAVFGLVGITGEETIRLNALAVPVGPNAAESCDAKVWFLGKDGARLSTEQDITIEAEEGTFVDLVGGSLGGPTGGGRISVRPLADIDCDKNLDLLFTVEVFDNATGGLHWAMPVYSQGLRAAPATQSMRPASPNTGLPADVMMTSGLIAITPGETLRLNVVSIPIRPDPGSPSGSCQGEVRFVDKSGDPLGSEHHITLQASEGAFADLHGGSLGGPTGGGRISVRPVADIECDHNLDLLFTVEIFDSASGLALEVVNSPPEKFGTYHPINEDGSRSGLVGITPQETLRLNAVAIPIRPGPGSRDGSCQAKAWFVGQDGERVGEEQQMSIEAEHGASVDQDGASLGGGPTTGGGRIPLRAVAELRCSKNLRSIFTVEVYESASGRLRAVMVNIGGNPD